MAFGSDIIEQALGRPAGARFYKCALQVNPFEYYKRYNKGTVYTTEDAFNSAIGDALVSAGVEVIAVTDHYRISTGTKLAAAARARGLVVFNGFEAVTKDGVHVLCLFDPNEDIRKIDRFIGDCGVHDQSQLSPVGDLDVDELLTACSEKWNGICVAAHVCSTGGLLTTLRGQTAIRAWTHKHLHACGIAGSIPEAPEGHRPILQNRNPDYLRDQSMAIVNANDITEPADAAQPSCSCWIKMASVSVEGLRQAFLHPVSRLRLASDEEPQERTELVAMAWEGGFLDGTTLHFNDSLNVLIGGRGTGKSTIIESIRFAFEGDPLVEDARKQHKAFVSQVLGSGAKISLLLHSQTPSPRKYLIERTCGSHATVKDSARELTELRPADIAPEIEVFGQHEISELARSEERLTGLLDRFVGHTTADAVTRDEIRTRLESTREQIVALEKSLAKIDADLAALPAIRETLKRYKDIGLDERLRDQKDLVTEKSILKSTETLVADAESKSQEVEELLPLDVSRFDEEKISELGGADLLRQVQPILKTLETGLRAAVTSLNKCIADAQTNLANIRSKWQTRETDTKQALTETLRELQKEGIDGAQYTDLLEKAEKLRPRKEQQAQLTKQLKQAIHDRRKVLQEWDDYKASQFRALERAAKKVSGKLASYVQVTVAAGGDRLLLEAHIRNLGGRIADTIEILREVDSLSLTSLAAACREGKDTLVREFGLPPAQAERLADAGTNFITAIEELDLPATTTIRLNVAREGAVPVWKKLDELSTGQKATAVLLLLLLDARGPLVVDQPEDDLDNRFITECIVPQVKEQKKRRQFIFSTHNANIPVLGDAELIAGLVPPIIADGLEVHLPDENLGSIDSKKVRELVEETLEGGREAFELRRLRYGF